MTEPTVPNLTRSQVLICMAVSAVVMMVLARSWTFMFDSPMVAIVWHPLHLAIGLGGGILITLASSLVYEIWAAYRVAANTYLEMILKPLGFFDLLWLGILPGMSEELLFRGVILPGLGMNLFGLVVSSTIFGILHMASPKHWQYAGWAIVVGMGLGTITIATHNLLPAVVTHILTNSLSGFLWMRNHQKLPNA